MDRVLATILFMMGMGPPPPPPPPPPPSSGPVAQPMGGGIPTVPPGHTE